MRLQYGLNTFVYRQYEWKDFSSYITNIEMYPSFNSQMVKWTFVKALEPGKNLFVRRYQDSFDTQYIDEFDTEGLPYVKMPYLHANLETNYIYIRFVFQTDNHTGFISPAMPLLQHQDIGFKYAVQEFKRIYSSYLGIDVIIFSSIFAGEPCPKCYNPQLKKATNPTCKVCFGTGYVGGYSKPIFARVYLATQPQTTFTANPNTQLNRAWMFYFPSDLPVIAGDIIYVVQNGMFLKVSDVSAIRWGTIPMLYRVQATTIPRPDGLIEQYEIDVKASYKQFFSDLR